MQEEEKTVLPGEALPESNRGVKLVWLDRYAYVMDNLIPIPGTSFRFGLDPILGFIPVVGSVAGFILSGILACYIIRYGASGRVIVKMLGNLILDLTVGSIPVFGLIFDFLYKSNDRNMKMMREHYFESKHQGSAIRPILLFVGVMLAVVVGIVFFFVAIVTALLTYLGSSIVS